MLKHQYEVHPAATLFPPMTEEEYQGLKKDIAENGQREDIVVWCDKLIDGRHRLRACEELQRNPHVSELDPDTDPWKYVISHNLHRRHLSETQRETVAAKLAKLKHGGERGNQHTGGKGSNDTLADAAAQLNVSEPSVKRAKAAIKGGCKELVEAMERDEITSSLAAKFVKAVPDKKEQAKILKQGIKAVRQVVKEATQPKQSINHLVQPEAIEYEDVEEQEEEQLQKPKEDNKLDEFKKFWAKCSDISKAAIRAWVNDN
jgi:ParB-like chromosome segregation protein Spo0J